MAQTGRIDCARIRSVVTVAQTGQITAHQAFSGNNRAFALTNVHCCGGIAGFGSLGTNSRTVSAEGIVDSTPQTPAVSVVRLTRLQKHIASTHPSSLNLDIDLFLVFTGNLSLLYVCWVRRQKFQLLLTVIEVPASTDTKAATSTANIARNTRNMIVVQLFVEVLLGIPLMGIIIGRFRNGHIWFLVSHFTVPLSRHNDVKKS